MKRTMITFNLSRVTRIVHAIGLMSRLFMLLSVFSLSFFTVLGLGGLMQSRMTMPLFSSMNGLANSVSSEFLADMIGMEVPAFHRDREESALSQNHVSRFLFEFLTDVNPWDPKSLMAAEMPQMRDDTVLLRKGRATNLNEAPVDYTPSANALGSGKAPDAAIGPPGPGSAASAPSPAGGGAVVAPDPSPGPSPDSSPSGPKASGGSDEAGKAGSESALSTHGKKVVFIYHSHNRESWVPELKDKGVTDLNQAYDAKKNVTLLGKRLSAKLEDLGIGASDSDVDYLTSVEKFNYNFSYKYSLQTLKQAVAQNRDYTYFFDIHRDSQTRDLTTAAIDGKSYAQIYFIIGHNNPHWEKNEQFAARIHERLEKEYPGLSRGLWGKGAQNGNGEYNQSFSPNDILIEVGGPENTLEESYRTIDVLAKVIADIYWDAEKVNAEKTNAEKADAKAKT